MKNLDQSANGDLMKLYSMLLSSKLNRTAFLLLLLLGGVLS
jgi:hypothetical protein